MRNQENIAKRGPVIWAEYQQRLDQLDILFKFVRHSFTSLSDRKRREFVQGLKGEREAEIIKGLEKLRAFSEREDAKGVIDKPSIEEHGIRQMKKLKADFRSETHAQYAEWVNDGMASMEILFRVTLFEDYLKHVHAAILNANPAVFSTANPGKQAKLEDIFSGSFEQFKENQINREVEHVSRQDMKSRLDYFAVHLGIDLSKQQKELIEISDIRNKIAHGNPLQAITAEDTSLPLKGIQETTATVIKTAMESTFVKGQHVYRQLVQSVGSVPSCAVAFNE